MGIGMLDPWQRWLMMWVQLLFTPMVAMSKHLLTSTSPFYPRLKFKFTFDSSFQLFYFLCIYSYMTWPHRMNHQDLTFEFYLYWKLREWIGRWRGFHSNHPGWQAVRPLGLMHNQGLQKGLMQGFRNYWSGAREYDLLDKIPLRQWRQ